MESWAEELNRLMEYFIERVTEKVYVIATWDEAWKTYNNCYIVADGEKTILIDSGKLEHTDSLKKALEKINKQENDINLIILTHGHNDHIGGSKAFGNVEKIIHIDDYSLLEPLLQEDYSTISSDEGSIGELRYFRVGHHTNGSIVLYMPDERVLFMGDFHCFFCEKLNKDHFVQKGSYIREKACKMVTELLKEEGAFEKYRLEEYFSGLNKMAQLQIDYLCTGHGMVLRDNISDFIQELIGCISI